MNHQHIQLVLKSVLILLFLICVWLAYQLVDQSVTLDHQTQHAETLEKQKNLLVNVFNSVSKNISESDIREVLAKLHDDAVFEKKNDHIVANQVSFFFSNGKLVRVEAGKQ